MTGVIEARDLAKSYAEVDAVRGVSLDIEAGAFYGILGPNGAGKTTLLEMIEGIREPDRGEARILGEKMWPRNQKVLPAIGVQLQASSFFERLTVGEQLETFADLYGAPHSRCEELIEVVGLEQKRSTQTEDLSGGQKQRLSIACALVHDPQVVFLDEPTAALDPQARRNLWDLLSRINDEGRTIVLTTHYMDEAQLLCDVISVMDHGEILTTGTPRALIESLGAVTRVQIDETPELSVDLARTLPGVESATLDNGVLSMSTHDPGPLLGALADRHTLGGLQVLSATLEDVFLDLTGREYRA